MLIRKFLTFLLFFLLVTPVFSKARPFNVDDLVSVRLLNHNNLPIKVLVKFGQGNGKYGNEKFTSQLTEIIAGINKTENLSGREKIKILTVGLNQPEPSFDPDVEKYHVPLSVRADRWLQDWGEVMMARTLSDSEEKLLVLDTNRRRGLNDFPAFLSKIWDSAFYRTIDPGFQNQPAIAGNYGGNIEATPNNVLYIGNTSSKTTRSFFTDHGYKDRHIVLDTKWLMVGHVDEYLSTIVLDDDPCGFAIVKADIQKGLASIINASKEDMDLGIYSKRPMASHLKDAKDYLDGNKNKRGKSFVKGNRQIIGIIRKNVKKLKDKIIEVSPSCKNIKVLSFPAVYLCKDNWGLMIKDVGGKRSCVSLLPGSVNMLVLRKHQIVPDPIFAPFKKQIKEVLLENGQTPHFIDDTLYYHEAAGEVHCGTNVMRLPNEYLIPALF